MGIRRKIIAGLLFLLAALLVIHVGSRFYFQHANPTSTKLIRGKLSSPEILGRFKVEEAKKAGYSEDEIVKFLADDNAASTEQSLQALFLVEATLFAVAMLVGLGVVILNPNSNRSAQ